MSSRERQATHTMVVVDEMGVIVAAAHREAPPSDDAPIHVEIRPRDGQRVYNVELPPELAAIGLTERIDRLHGNYCVGPNGDLRVVDKQSAR
jgi:hypothetical protein